MAVYQSDEQQQGQYGTQPKKPRTGAQAGYDQWLDNEQALYQAPQGGGSTTTPAVTPTYNTNGYAQPGYTAQPNQYAPAGWEPTKWTDNSYQSPKYAVGRILADAGAPSIQTIQNALPQLQQAYPGLTFNGKDLLTIPGVGTIDVLSGASTGDPNQMAWWWGDTAGTGPAGAGGAGAGSGGPGAAGAPGGALSAAQNAMLLRLMDPSYVTPDPNDPALKQKTDVYRAEAERARRSRRDAELEALGARGLGASGAADASLASGYDDMGRSVAGYAANAISQEQQARRAEMMQALELATQMGMQDEANALRMQIAQLDATLTREGRAQQNTQFNDTLGWEMARWQNELPWRYLDYWG